MPSGQDLVNRLQEETRRTLSQHITKFAEEFRALQNNLSASISSINQIEQRLGSVDGVDNPAVEAVLAEALEGAAQEEARRRDEETSFLAHFAHDLRQKETQEEILHALLDGAHRYAPRLVLFVTRGSQFVGWSSRGFSEQATQQINGYAFPTSESGLLHSALEADGLTTANDASEEKALAQFLAEGMEGPWHAFPLKAIQRPVAVLLASAAAGTACNLEALCVLMDLTGLCVENMALRLLCELKMTGPSMKRETLEEDAGSADAEPAAVAAEEESVRILTGEAEMPVLPEPVEAAAPATIPWLEPAAHFQALPMEPQAGMLEPAVPDQAEEVAAGQSEAPLAAAAALPLTTVEPEAASPAAEAPIPEAVAAEVPMPEGAARETPRSGEEKPEPVRPAVLREVQPLSEEEKIHADAKRFARLLASEIKLYNEQRVEEGRLNRDIYVRLKRDIDRSRDMYEKRVSPLVSRRVDYFHDELIRVLGDNDPSTLGSDYPGPRVES
jgi:hypothetical protein